MGEMKPTNDENPRVPKTDNVEAQMSMASSYEKDDVDDIKATAKIESLNLLSPSNIPRQQASSYQIDSDDDSISVTNRMQPSTTEVHLMSKPSSQMTPSLQERINTKKKSSTETPFLNLSEMLKYIGQISESDEVQLAIIFLIFFDLISSSGLLVLSDWSDGSDEITSTFLCKFLHSVTIFTFFSFVLELVALILSFGVKKFFSHKGYTVDFCIILLCLLVEMHFSTILSDKEPYISTANNGGMVTAGKEIRLLGFLRCWRIVRIVESTVKKAELEHQSIQSTLEEELLKMEDICKSLTLATEKVKKETDARRQVEKMLRQYKEEVDVLNEALNLAAMDVASPRSGEDEVPLPAREEEGLQLLQIDGSTQQQLAAEIAKDGTINEQPISLQIRNDEVERELQCAINEMG